MNLIEERDQLAQELCDIVTEIHAQGWAPGTGGNFSVTLSRRPVRLLITQSGLHKRRLDPSRDLVEVGEDGRPVAGQTGRPSAETLLHTAIVDETGAGATLHTHSVAGTLLSEHFVAQGGLKLRDYEMLKGLEGVRSHDEEVFFPVLPNTQDMVALAEDVRELLRRPRTPHGFLLSGHGLYTWGADLLQALRHVEVFEFLLESVARRTAFAPFQG